MIAKKNVLKMLFVTLIMNTASAASLSIIESGIQNIKLCPFPVPERMNNVHRRYKDALVVDAAVSGQLSDYIQDECNAPGNCLFTLTVYKSDKTVVATSRLHPSYFAESIRLAKQTSLNLAYDQEILTPNEFPLNDGSHGDEVVEYNSGLPVLHSTLTVSRLFSSPLRNNTVAIWSTTGYVTSTYGFEAPLDGKCVEDAFEVDFNFDE